MVGPYGLSHSVYTTAKNISKLDTGVITTYATYIGIGALSLIFITFGYVIMGEMIINPNLLIIVFLCAKYILELLKCVFLNHSKKKILF